MTPAAPAAILTITFPGQTTPTPVATTTTLPGTEITINDHTTVHIPGDATDPADFYGIILVIIGIAVAILLTRLIFNRGGRRR